MDADSTFTKTTGTIYGNVAAPLGNTATSEGQAAYVVTGTKKRDSTAGPGDAMDSTKDSTAGGWD
jgi:hypothetical protein